jgi:hypothetical protein
MYATQWKLNKTIKENVWLTDHSIKRRYSSKPSKAIIRYIIRIGSDGYLPLYTHIALAFALAHNLSALTSAWQSIRMWICVERRCREERHCAEGDVGEIFLLMLLWMCGVGGGIVRVVVGVRMAGLGLGLGLSIGVVRV